MKKIVRPTLSRWAGIDYEVVWKPRGEVVGDSPDELCYGTTEHEHQRITVEDGHKPERECDTLVHETLHQIIGTAQQQFRGETTADIEEEVCTFLGTALAGHIRDNPNYWRYLIKRLAPRKRKPKQWQPGTSPASGPTNPPAT